MSNTKSFLKDNFILFAANLIGAAFAYFYHFYTGRVLGPEEYGIIIAIMSITYILTVIIYTIQTAIAKYISELKISNENEKISYIAQKLFLHLTIIGTLGSILLFLLANPISIFLKISPTFIQIISPVVLFVTLLPVSRGILQGLQKFKGLSIVTIIEGPARFLAAIILIKMGFGTIGAILAITISFLLPLLYSLLPLKKILLRKTKPFPLKKIYKYCIPVTLALFGMSLFFSIDIILVKHFFNAQDAGLYGAISNLGKIIYFASFTIGMVLFPKISEVMHLEKKRKKLLYQSLILVLLISLPAVIMYYFLPTLPILILYGHQYLSIAPLIGNFALFMMLISLSYILTYYHLAKENYPAIASLFIFIGIETVLILLFHNSLSAIISTLVLTSALSFLTLLLFVYIE
jgi:O-antigen/teichoic acid export membrane protein